MHSMELKLKKLQKSLRFKRTDLVRFLLDKGLKQKTVIEITGIPEKLAEEISNEMGLPKKGELMISRGDLLSYLELGLNMMDISRATEVPYHKVREACTYYNLKKFNTQVHPELIVKMHHLKQDGFSNTQIAKKLGVTIRQIEFLEPYVNDMSLDLRK